MCCILSPGRRSGGPLMNRTHINGANQHQKYILFSQRVNFNIVADLSSIKNFGPYMVKIMNQIGIYSKEDLLSCDYSQIKSALIANNIKPHPNIFYSIEMGLQDRAWNSISAAEKKELLQILEKSKL